MADERFIFLSYRSTEIDFALQLATDLKNAGIRIWMDRLDLKPGDDWVHTIQNAVGNCSGFIAALSPAYASSKHCQRELSRADRMELPIFPVLYRALPDAIWPFVIEQQQYIDFTQWRDESVYKSQLEVLASTIKERIGQIDTPPNPESQYLMRVISQLRSPSGPLEYIEHAQSIDSMYEDPLPLSQTYLQHTPTRGAFTEINRLSSTDNVLLVTGQTVNDLEIYVEAHPACLIAGAAGSGKTRILRHLALKTALSRQGDEPAGSIPLFLNAAYWEDDQSLEDFIRASWSLDSDPLKVMAKGQIAVFIDGLSELGTTLPLKMQQIATWLNGDNAPTHIVMTCRFDDVRFLPDLNVSIIQIDDIPQEQFAGVVSTYMPEAQARVFTDMVLSQKLHSDANGDHATQESSLYQLARKPFFLQVLMLLYQKAPDSALPHTAGKAVKQLTRTLWNQYQSTIQSDAITYTALESALSDLAYAMLEGQMPTYVTKPYALEHLGTPAILEAAENAHFIQVRKGQVRFSYEIFQSYFAALRLTLNLLDTLLLLPRFNGYGYRVKQSWDSSAVLLAGLVEEAQSFVEVIANINPYLALECVLSGVQISEPALNQTMNQLLYMMRESVEDGRIAAIQLVHHFDRELALEIVLDTLEYAEWPIRQAAYEQLSLLPTEPFPSLIKVLQHWDQSLREAATIALRQFREGAVPTLIQLLNNSDWKLRRGAAWALGELHSDAAVPGLVHLLNDPDDLVSREAANALGQINDPAAIPWLLKALYDDNWRIRRAAAQAMGSMGAPAIEALLTAFQDESASVRRLAITGLKQIQDEIVLVALLEATYDADVEVRQEAIESLPQSEEPMIVNRLIACLWDKASPRRIQQRICDIAAELLEKIGTPQAKAAVQSWRQGALPEPPSEHNTVDSSAATAKTRLLGQQTKRKSLDLLVIHQGLQSSDWQIRHETVLSLKAIELERIRSLLEKSLRDLHPEVRQAAVDVLGQSGQSQAIPLLLLSLKDAESRVIDAVMTYLPQFDGEVVVQMLNAGLQQASLLHRANMVRAMGHVGHPTAEPILKDLLSDETVVENQTRICDLAAGALTEIGSESALDTVKEWRTTAELRSKLSPDKERPHRVILDDLLAALQEKQWRKREDAAKALREYTRSLSGGNNKDVIRVLGNMLQHRDWVVRWAVVEALAWVGDETVLDDMIALLDDPNVNIRVAVLRALSEIGHVRAVPAVERTLADEEFIVREAAAEALGDLGDSSILPTLQKHLNDPDPFVRLAIVDSLGRIGGIDSIPPLIGVLQDSDGSVRWAATLALSRIQDTKAMNALIGRLQDTYHPDWEEKRICDLAADALEQIDNPKAREALQHWRASHEL